MAGRLQLHLRPSDCHRWCPVWAGLVQQSVYNLRYPDSLGPDTAERRHTVAIKVKGPHQLDVEEWALPLDAGGYGAAEDGDALLDLLFGDVAVGEAELLLAGLVAEEDFAGAAEYAFG